MLCVFYHGSKTPQNPIPATLQILNKPAVVTPTALESSHRASRLSGAGSGQPATHTGAPRGRDRPADQGEALCLSAQDTLVAREGEPSHGNGGAGEPSRHQERKTKAPQMEPGETLPVTPVTAGKRLPVCNAPSAGAASQPCPRGGQCPAPDRLPQMGPALTWSSVSDRQISWEAGSAFTDVWWETCRFKRLVWCKP